MGLKSFGLFAPLFFAIGTTSDCFQVAGICPEWIDILNSLVMEGAIAEAVDFSIRAEMPSFPLALVVLEDRYCWRCFVEKFNNLPKVLGIRWLQFVEEVSLGIAKLLDNFVPGMAIFGFITAPIITSLCLPK